MVKTIYPIQTESLNSQEKELHQERVIAAFDIGTNSIHMVIVKIDPSLPAFNIIAREKDTVRLGDRDPKTGFLTLDAMERAMSTLQRGQELARSFNAEEIVAVATSAVREAPNGREFIKTVREELGLTIDLISGQEEARRIYLGVLSAMEFNEKPHAIIDIGGGSTELILGNGQEPRSLSSTKVGAVRLAQEYITTDPINNKELKFLQAYIRGSMERPVEELNAQLSPEETISLVGTSGTIECLATIHAKEKLNSNPNPLQGYSFTTKDLEDIVKLLASLDVKKRADLPGMSDRRAEIILPGAMILLETMKLLGVDEITICERALREGVIVDWMLTHGLIENRLRYQSSVRDRSVIHIAQKYQVDLDYSQRVANFALSIFDQTQGKLHQWGSWERELLWVAAILHNCGFYVSHAAHHKHSYYLIRHAELLGFTENELEIIANIARYHRKSKPKKKHENYQNLPDKNARKFVSEVSAILRLAIALDRRQIGAITAFNCYYKEEEKELHLELFPKDKNDDCALEFWNLEQKKGIFENQYGVKVIAYLSV
ncbi:Ppx/GppA family phosphatase [Euhalothece natronophila Z-M001]|uniref:Ppx/GppA family phosphatase n=1 Tax=Euhalothece natronophila Z-M001 TaxID=522448 RepID=A0A5B8NJV5_9CHRO|nr:Ppx/GppA phosphatase family protein [Euhalothece natronophila]QDZ38801.1 Ppx/GppA family phosphatase [Euhalothece natronophila Z-M001]